MKCIARQPIQLSLRSAVDRARGPADAPGRRYRSAVAQHSRPDRVAYRHGRVLADVDALSWRTYPWLAPVACTNFYVAKD